MLMTLKEVMEFTHVSRATVFKWLKDGRIERIKRPGMKNILFERLKMEQFILKGEWPKDEN